MIGQNQLERFLSVINQVRCVGPYFKARIDRVNTGRSQLAAVNLNRTHTAGGNFINIF